jgi:hypothetical protein
MVSLALGWISQYFPRLSLHHRQLAGGFKAQTISAKGGSALG